MREAFRYIREHGFKAYIKKVFIARALDKGMDWAVDTSDDIVDDWLDVAARYLSTNEVIVRFDGADNIEQVSKWFMDRAKYLDARLRHWHHVHSLKK